MVHVGCLMFLLINHFKKTWADKCVREVRDITDLWLIPQALQYARRVHMLCVLSLLLKESLLMLKLFDITSRLCLFVLLSVLKRMEESDLLKERLQAITVMLHLFHTSS